MKLDFIFIERILARISILPKISGFGFVCVCRHQFLMFSKRSRGILNQSNIEILARTYLGNMACMVVLVIVFIVFTCPMFSLLHCLISY